MGELPGDTQPLLMTLALLCHRTHTICGAVQSGSEDFSLCCRRLSSTFVSEEICTWYKCGTAAYDIYEINGVMTIWTITVTWSSVMSAVVVKPGAARFSAVYHSPHSLRLYRVCDCNCTLCEDKLDPCH